MEMISTVPPQLWKYSPNQEMIPLNKFHYHARSCYLLYRENIKSPFIKMSVSFWIKSILNLLKHLIKNSYHVWVTQCWTVRSGDKSPSDKSPRRSIFNTLFLSKNKLKQRSVFINDMRTRVERYWEIFEFKLAIMGKSCDYDRFERSENILEKY